MKFYLILSLIFCFSFSNTITVTPEGLRAGSDPAKKYVVLKIDDVNSTELYNRALKYIYENHKDPEKSIVAKIEGNFLKFNTHVNPFLYYNNSGIRVKIKATYTTELKFKDNKIRYEISSIKMKSLDGKYQVLFSGGLFSGYIIYKRNGDLFKPDTKSDIEEYFNKEIVALKTFLSGDKGKDEDW
jgi:hypothetical protein